MALSISYESRYSEAVMVSVIKLTVANLGVTVVGLLVLLEVSVV
jgi:hypothetical protein